MKTKKPTATCPHCGEKFTSLKEGKIPTHDFPKPCRSVCPGTGEEPKRRNDTLLWKDSPGQRANDFFDAARLELKLIGFAVVKELAAITGSKSGSMQCPLCGKQVWFSVATSNGHCAARCQTAGCINATE